MDDALLVGGGQSAGDLHRVGNRRANRQGAAAEHVAQRPALDRLGDDVRRLRVGADVMDRQDVGVRQQGGRARLLLEAPQTVGIGGKVGPQHTEGDVPLLVVVAGGIHFAES